MSIYDMSLKVFIKNYIFAVCFFPFIKRGKPQY